MSVAEVLHVYKTPLEEVPIAPAGVQNAPGVTFEIGVLELVETVGVGEGVRTWVGVGETVDTEEGLALAVGEGEAEGVLLIEGLGVGDAEGAN